MVKTFTLRRSLPLASSAFYARLLSAKFEEKTHQRRGDKAITVTDWMDTAPRTRQRMCFFTLVDASSGGVGDSVCMETQILTTVGQEDLVLKCSIVPDNATMGNVFRIVSTWNIRPQGANECSLEILAEVECKAAMWGVGGLVESSLASVVESAYETWLQAASEEIRPVSVVDRVVSSGEKQLRNIRARVMDGTEHIANMFMNEGEFRRRDRTRRSHRSSTSLPAPARSTSPRPSFRRLPTRCLLFFLFLILLLLFYYVYFRPPLDTDENENGADSTLS